MISKREPIPEEHTLRTQLSFNVYLMYLDVRDENRPNTHPQPQVKFISIQVGDKPHKTMKIGANITPHVQAALSEFLNANSDLFG